MIAISLHKNRQMKFLSACVTALLTLLLCNQCVFALQGTQTRPNVLWLSTEDIGPQLACYGDTTAKTPHLDALAAQGLTYDVAWSNYPVCAPARTTIISGMYAGTLGAGNMRSQVKLPADIKMFPQYLRETGYYCTNTSKEDYNLIKPNGVWDKSNKTADWRERKLGQPFFAVVNFSGTHEGKIRNSKHTAVIDPASVKLPPYWPDTPEVRKDWAQYYDNLMKMDDWIASELKKLEVAGVDDETIVVFFGDHGSGMPRHKRYVGDSGMRVPFVVYVPKKLRANFAPQEYSPGGRSQRPIGFVDLAPTMLSIADIEAPKFMQGRAFLGPKQVAIEDQPEYLFGFRERMDERPDLSFSVRDKQFIYVRNFMPHLPAGQKLQFQLMTPTTSKWLAMFEAGELNPVQARFWQPKATEELYDLKTDPGETNNLAGDPQHQATVERFRQAFTENLRKVGALSFVHEGRMQAITDEGKRMRRDLAADQTEFPFEQILEIAGAVGGPELDVAKTQSNIAKCVEATTAKSPIVRYWATMGLLNGGQPEVAQHGDLLKRLLEDEAPEVALTAAEALLKFDANPQTVAKAKQVVVKYCDMKRGNAFYALTAVNIVDRHWNAFEDQAPAILALPSEDPAIKRGGNYLVRMFKIFKQRLASDQPY